MNASYNWAVNGLIDKLGEAEYDRRMRLAGLYWGPNNLNDQAEISNDHFGGDPLFGDVIYSNTGRRRFFFGFHDVPRDNRTDFDYIMGRFMNCKNWETYLKLWVKFAPYEFRNKWFLAVLLTDMTVKGFMSEAKFEAHQRSLGHHVVEASSNDDINGVDFYVNGKKKQVKSEGTLRLAAKRGIEIENV